MGKSSTDSSAKKKRTLLARLRSWLTRRRKGAYFAQNHEDHSQSPKGPYTNSELVDTFSVEEDLDSCCQGLLYKNGSQCFDSSPLLLKEDSSSNSSVAPEYTTSRTVSFGKTTEIRDKRTFDRKNTQGSEQSLESLDSLPVSYREGEDEESLATHRVNNTSDAIMKDHVHFLRVATQPRQVELVWKTKPSRKTQL